MASTVFGIKLENQSAKWLLVGGLGAVLMGVILFGGGDAAEETAELATTANSSPSGEAGTAAAVPGPRRGGLPATPKSPRKTREWPRLDPVEVIKHNPFTLSEAAAEQLALESGKTKDVPTAEELAALERNKRREQLVEELRRTRVSMIFRSDAGNAAVIGNRVLKEGEIVEGVRIVSITNSGITVEPSE